MIVVGAAVGIDLQSMLSLLHNLVVCFTFDNTLRGCSKSWGGLRLSSYVVSINSKWNLRLDAPTMYTFHTVIVRFLRVQLRVRRSQSIVFSCWHQGSGNLEIPTCTCAAGASTAATAGAAALMRSIVHVDPIDCC